MLCPKCNKIMVRKQEGESSDSKSSIVWVIYSCDCGLHIRDTETREELDEIEIDDWEAKQRQLDIDLANAIDAERSEDENN